MSLTRSAILLNGEDRPIFLRYRTSQAVTIRPVVTVLFFLPSAQQKTPIEFNRRSGALIILDSVELWTGHKGSGIIAVVRIFGFPADPIRLKNPRQAELSLQSAVGVPVWETAGTLSRQNDSGRK